MTKRSNEFQKLIYLIERQLASQNVIVKESKMLKDSKTGQEREIDIYVETEINGHQVNLAIECRDHKRKSGVQWIDKLIGQYSSLPIHKVIAVSKSGFTDSAFEKAYLNNIVLLSLEEAIDQNWVRVVNNIDAILLTLIRFQIAQIIFESNDISHLSSNSTINVYSPDGEDYGILNEYPYKLLGNKEVHSEILNSLTSNFDESSGCFRGNKKIASANWSFKSPLNLIDDSENKTTLKSITYKFRCVINKISVPTRKLSYNNAQVASITKKINNMNFIVSVSERENQKPTLAVSLELERKNKSNLSNEIITKPLPTYEGKIHVSCYMLPY